MGWPIGSFAWEFKRQRSGEEATQEGVAERGGGGWSVGPWRGYLEIGKSKLIVWATRSPKMARGGRDQTASEAFAA